ncbi:unnamed protein product [Closterium sp. Naga37s-1]|nr:unnamed protein product [Closterium sp. Naga37s-1]
MLLRFLLVLALSYGLRGSEGARGGGLAANRDPRNRLGSIDQASFGDSLLAFGEESGHSGDTRNLLLAQDATPQRELHSLGEEQRQVLLETVRIYTEPSQGAMLEAREAKLQEKLTQQQEKEMLEKERPELKQQRLQKEREMSRLQVDVSVKAYREYQERTRQEELYMPQERQAQRGRSMVTCVRQEKTCTAGMCKNGETCKPMNTCRGYICLVDRSNLQTKTPRTKVDKISKSPAQGSLAPEEEDDWKACGGE